MKRFLKTKAGLVSMTAFLVVMALVFHRVVQRRNDRRAAVAAGVSAAQSGPVTPAQEASGGPDATIPPVSPSATATLAENAACLDLYYQLGRRAREDRDRQGNPVTRRENAHTSVDAGWINAAPDGPDVAATSRPPPARGSLRLQGRPSVSTPGLPVLGQLEHKLPRLVPSPLSDAPVLTPEPLSTSAAPVRRHRPERFNPYGRLIKCELVFTVDSTNEETPLIAVVMEPVWNNGVLVIPAGAEFHGFARPDRLRDRLFSAPDWILVFPREGDRVSGRQLNVKGVALDRIEPDAGGMTWGITDGSYGLQGAVIRTQQEEEIKRFAATFLAAGAQTLQERESSRGGQVNVRNTPGNAVLQGLAANLQKMADEISAEITRHGVFIRVPGGHQFYFYPMQIIDADAADISSDIATVK